MKTNREKKICDTVTLEQKVEDIENRARLLENERRDLLLQCSGRVHTSISRVVQTQAILALKSMSERDGSDIQRH